MAGNNESQIIHRIDTAESVFSSEASWSDKFDRIFAMEISKDIRAAGYDFGWCDPDSSCEADVRAYMAALLEFRARIRPIAAAVESSVANAAIELLERIQRDMAWRLSNAGTKIDRSDYEDLLRFITMRTSELKPVATVEPQR